MKIIQKQSNLFEQYIPRQAAVAGYYRPSQFLIFDPERDCALHALTREIVHLNESEYRIIQFPKIEYLNDNSIVKELIEKWWLVPVTFDEASFYNEAYALNRLVSPENETKSLYKIFTTTACNARCYYCFEAGTPINTMSCETAEQVIQYILSTRHDKEIKLYWFGGEPLCNTAVISKICASLKKIGVPFSSDMISNGLLFQDSLISEAASEWNLRLCQITLDGTPERYKQIKAYVGNVDNPFEKVIGNIHSLLNAGIAVRIRLNINHDNKEDIIQLKNFLLNEFNDCKNLSIYPAAISSEWLGYHDPYEPSRNSDMGSILTEIRKELAGKTESKRFYVSKTLPVSHCMANSRHAVVIDPNGDLYTCQGCDKQMRYGNIWDGVLYPEVYEAWKCNDEIREQCKTCPYLPECTAFDKCPSHQPNCREIMESRMHRRLRNTIEKLCYSERR